MSRSQQPSLICSTREAVIRSVPRPRASRGRFSMHWEKGVMPGSLGRQHDEVYCPYGLGRGGTTAVGQHPQRAVRLNPHARGLRPAFAQSRSGGGVTPPDVFRDPLCDPPPGVGWRQSSLSGPQSRRAEHSRPRNPFRATIDCHAPRCRGHESSRDSSQHAPVPL